MIAIPFLYFLVLAVFFYRKNGKWGIDVAATVLLAVISLCAIMIEVRDIYGDYGINRKSYNIFTLLLFCLQWTIALLPLHVISKKQIMPLEQVKRKSLFLFCGVMLFFATVLIQSNFEDIKMALIMDFADVREEHYAALRDGAEKGSNFLLLFPKLFTNVPFPTIALLIWFYMYSFIKGNHILKTCILLASVVQAILSIVIAGRAAMVYWIFDFYLAFCLFYKYLSKGVRRAILLAAGAVFALMVSAMLLITFSRYDGSRADRDPLESIYGYAGQQVNNFSIMFTDGWNSPFTIDREFPLLYKVLYHKQFDLFEHYEGIESKTKVMSHVFDTFGAEVFLDLGVIGYVIMLLMLLMLAYLLNRHWEKIQFNRVLLCGVYVAFFSHGLFAWPFVNHYTTLALMLAFGLSYFFKYRFKI